MNFGFTYDALALVARAAPDNFADVVERLVEAGDFKSLRQVGRLSDGLVLAHLSEAAHRRICFSVLHWFDPLHASEDERKFAGDWMRRYGVGEAGGRFNLETQLCQILSGARSQLDEFTIELSRCRALLALGAKPFTSPPELINACAATMLVGGTHGYAAFPAEFEVPLLKEFLRTAPDALPMLESITVEIELLNRGNNTKIYRRPEYRNLVEAMLESSSRTSLLPTVLDVYADALAQRNKNPGSAPARLWESFNQAHLDVFGDGRLTASGPARIEAVLPALLDGVLDRRVSQVLWSSSHKDNSLAGKNEASPFPIILMKASTDDEGASLFGRFLDRMIEDGVDIDSLIETRLGGGKEYATLLFYAISEHREEAVRALIIRGADPLKESISKGVEGQVIGPGQTPLDLAVSAAASAPVDDWHIDRKRSIAKLLRSRQAQMAAQAAMQEIAAYAKPGQQPAATAP